MARRTVRATPSAPRASKDVDYTIPGLIVIVAAVLITALFFAQPNVAVRASALGGGNLGGQAYATPGTDGLEPSSCDAMSLCDGSRLIRQQADCTQFIANCQNGCEYRGGTATCI